MEDNQYFDLNVNGERAGLVEFKGAELVDSDETYRLECEDKFVELSKTKLKGEKLRKTPAVYVVSATYEPLLEDSPVMTKSLKKGGQYEVKINFNDEKAEAIDALLERLADCYISKKNVARDSIEVKKAPQYSEM